MGANLLGCSSHRHNPIIGELDAVRIVPEDDRDFENERGIAVHGVRQRSHFSHWSCLFNNRPTVHCLNPKSLTF